MSGSGLGDDYIAGSPAIAPFYPGYPWDPEAYRRKADEVRSRFDPTRLARMADAITPTSDAAAPRLQRIANGEGFFVTTGQQTGLFTGPLYTVHKTLSAVALARALERALDVPVAPLFWVASDDHDWEEVNHADFLDRDNRPHRVELHAGSDRRPSMGRRALGREIESALNDLAEVLPDSDFSGGLLDHLRAAYQPDHTVAQAFTETVRDLFGAFDLLVTDAQDSVVRELGADLLRAELAASADHEQRLAGQTARLAEAGYEAQVSIIEGATNVFYEDAHGRERILRDDGGWVLRASHRRMTDGELWDMFDRDREGFSANVLLRPVLESHVFPTLAYVAGPGELRYLAQTGCLFEAHDVGMPLVFPRFGVALVETKVRKVLDKLGLDLAAFERPAHEIAAEYVQDEMPEPAMTALSSLRQAIQEGYQELFDASRPVDPTLKGPIFHARNASFQALSDAEKKIRQHVRQQHEIAVDQIQKAFDNLRPHNKPQERVLNVYHYLARYGRDLLGDILGRMEIHLERTPRGWDGVHCR
ncbi:MAG: bacillithiol biosynthesis cysteine-adding enzyme BshC [Gemmatimonadota bacterium]